MRSIGPAACLGPSCLKKTLMPCWRHATAVGGGEGGGQEGRVGSKMLYTRLHPDCAGWSNRHVPQIGALHADRAVSAPACERCPLAPLLPRALGAVSKRGGSQDCNEGILAHA